MPLAFVGQHRLDLLGIINDPGSSEIGPFQSEDNLVRICPHVCSSRTVRVSSIPELIMPKSHS
jgi:hypothetical protein